MTDIEQALRESEEKLRVISDESLLGILIVQGERVLYANQEVANSTGYDLEEIRTWRLEDFARVIHPDDLPFAMDQARRKLAGEDGAVEHYCFRLFAPDGDIRWVETFARSVQVGGRLACLLTLVDMTERIEREEANRLLAAAVENAGEMILITDTQGTIEYVNHAFERITGYAAGEALGCPAVMLDGPAVDEARWADIRRELLEGRCWKGRLTGMRKDGATFETRATISPVRDTRGQIVKFVSVERDVTQEAALERRLWQAEKAEAIGQLAGGIAHDFNNLLTAILGNAQLLQAGSVGEGDRHECMAAIVHASQRAAELTSQLLTFARRRALRCQQLDLHEVITGVIELLRPSLGERIEVRRELAAPQAIVFGDRSQLESALMNLGLNARDAMPDGGVLTFATREIEREAQDGLPPGTYVETVVRDTGVGMDAAPQQRIFEPFFTTKEVGKGTGLGLASVYGCVRSHNGSIRVESAPGRGATFRLLLPLSAAPPAAGGAARHVARRRLAAQPNRAAG